MKIYFIKKANKDYLTEGIEKGDEYYYCEPKGLRKTTRKIRRHTAKEISAWILRYMKSFQGEFASNMDSWSQTLNGLEDEDQKEELLQEINDFIEQKQQNLDNIPHSLQESHVLNEQIDELEQFRDEVQQWTNEDN
jgi:microsomal dipeptidase-like Zn-dependent dipeptidase